MRTTVARALSAAALWILMGCDTGDVDLRVKVLVPPDIPPVSSGVLRLSLWVYDPLLADASATLADADSARFSHQSGVANTFSMHVNTHVAGRQKFYITVRGFELSPACEKYILWDGHQETQAPPIVVMRPIPAAACPAPQQTSSGR
ncbi:MAG TPA: hypothetical protein VFT29_18890 [Gemmatimonadaceae bacterium]|nr:hypothetical protein [Gemmatimonadaceae bacterium]